ncbi:flagellar biosynthetic protein FliO [Brevibacillus ginsengisoli]|uniref:flagellar biosynthetic protein FliO n=1 Tax=Brevibacillus ginsengisoli TaxID=363854 RepID=UPI003CFA1E44
MKRFQAGPLTLVILCAVLLFINLTPSYCYADPNRSVSEAMKNGGISTTTPSTQPGNDNSGNALGSKPSGWTFLFQVIFSLGLIVVLIYLLLRFLGSKNLKGFNQNGAVKVISTVPLGNGKNLQIVMIADSLYLLGVGNDVNLIRYIPNGEEADLILSEVEMNPPNIGLLQSLLSLRKKQDPQDQELNFQQEKVSGTFEQLLGQKWDEVKRANMRSTNVIEEERKDPGERL